LGVSKTALFLTIPPKSRCAAEWLANIDPNILVEHIDRYLTLDENGVLHSDLSNYDIIIDTTGEDQVLAMLSAAKWKYMTVFCSSSVGLGAKRMYINIQAASQPDF